MSGELLVSSKARVPATCPYPNASGQPPGAAAPSTITIDQAVVCRQGLQRAAGSPLEVDQVVTPHVPLRRAVTGCSVSAWRCGGGGLVEALFARQNGPIEPSPNRLKGRWRGSRGWFVENI